MRPLFLLSLPRSGSTLVQRVLGAHPRVATVSEPWLLLAPLYATRVGGVRAEYNHETAAGALEDFCAELPGGRDDYRAAVREFALGLYARAGGEDADWFLDKTPHYHPLAAELPAVFPDAAFVFLWRQPLDVTASFLDSFRAGRFEPYQFAFDLFDGVASLTAARAAAGERAHAVRYEDLVGGDDAPWRAIFEHLELDFDPELLRRFTQTELRGRYGDRSRAASIGAGSVGNWRAHAGSRVANAWCRRYVRWIGRERMSTMGYDHDATLRAVEAVPHDAPGALDALHLARSRLAHARRTRALRLPEGPRPIVRGERRA